MISKKAGEEEKQLTLIFSAVSDPTRRKILSLLSINRQTVVGMSANFEMSLPAVSKHIRILEQAGLIKREIKGRTHWLELQPTPLKKAAAWIHFYEQFWRDQLDSLESFLKEEDHKS